MLMFMHVAVLLQYSISRQVWWLLAMVVSVILIVGVDNWVGNEDGEDSVDLGECMTKRLIYQ
jgi:hypothetical protein